MIATEELQQESIFARCKRLYSPSQVIMYLLPDGEQRGNEWVTRNPTRDDKNAGSFSINLKTGAWLDAATNDKGGDFIDLWGYLRAIENPYEAARQIDAELNGKSSPPITAALRKPRDEDPVEILWPIPSDASLPTFKHPDHDICPAYYRYHYRAKDGRTLGYVCRWDLQDGKAIVPRFYFRCADGVMRWKWAGPKGAHQRPLYNLDKVEGAEGIWVVEGEKTAEAARHFANPTTCVVTWMGGSSSVDKVDFTPLAGKRVVLIPDCDAKRDKATGKPKPYSTQPGVQAMMIAASKLLALDCKVWIIDYVIDEREDGWDLADALAANWTKQQVQAMMQANQRVLGQKKTDSNFGKTPLYQPLLMGDLLMKPSGKSISNVWMNYKAMFDAYGITCRHNLMTSDIEIVHVATQRHIEADEIISMAETNGIPISQINAHISVIAKRDNYHPAIEWIEQRPWDGHDRIAPLFSTIRLADTRPELAFRLLYRSLIQAVAMLCQTRRGDQDSTPEAHGVLTLLGLQGCGKTRWIRALAPSPFVMVGVSIDVNNKDSLIRARSRWLVEIGEVSGTKNKSDIALLKAYLTSPEDSIRLPYDRRAMTMPRRTVFFATENNRQYLTDTTGNRRWWTISVKAMDHAHTIDMQQLWAQVKHLLDGGEQWWLTDEEMILLGIKNLDHEVSDPVADILYDELSWDDSRLNWTFRPAGAILRELDFMPIHSGSCRSACKFFTDMGCETRRSGDRPPEWCVPHKKKR